MTNLNEWFSKGTTKFEYIASMNVHKENLLKVYNGIQFSNEEIEFLRSLQTKGLKAVILTADWCGDAMVNLPIFMRMADEALLETRYLIRDENLELMDQYLTNGTARSIPIIILLDQEGKEAGKWGPRAPQVQSLVDGLRSGMPAKDEPGYEEAFRTFATNLTGQFTSNSELWGYIKEDLLSVLKGL